jgi:hypothetical protein
MATDKSEPRVGLIARVAVLSLVTLVAAHAALVSYFDHYARAEEQRKYGDLKAVALENMRADEAARLTAGSMPIDKAMQQIVARGRMAASSDIKPAVSKDVAPLLGWSKMPSEVPPAMTAEPPPAPPAEATGDGGTAPSTKTDGGALNSKLDRARPDAGAPTKPPTKKP